MFHRVALSLLIWMTACDKGQATTTTTTPAEAKPGDVYLVTRETPFYDSGCAQARPNDGKLAKGTRFTLVGKNGSCWNVKLGDEDETYIQPDNVAPAR
jgi:hypothetical protein